jgi:glycosyltransferase involved in cell wall biosynthesis
MRDIFRVSSYDIVYVHLWVTPLGPPLFEKVIRKMAKRVIFDIDDLVYLKDVKSRATPLISKLKGAGKPIYLMKTADHVITCTPYLDSFVRQYNPHTTDISSTVNTDVYTMRQDYTFKEVKIVLGWSGSHSTSRYLRLLEQPLKKLKERIDFKLLVMGDEDFFMDGLDIEAKPWDKSYELATISRFDIGLYPLPDEEWVYGKSGLKAIQYMAMGIPTLATAIGANYRVIESEVSGFLIEKEDEWVDRIMQLVGDIDLRTKIGRQARKRVEEMFSIKSNELVYLNVLTDVLDYK